MDGSTMLLALTGWMDGGLVSTGTVNHLMQGRDLVDVARIEPAGFYIDNFPGSMEVSALFRPHVKYRKGLIRKFEMPSNEFRADVAGKLAFFVGKEPNLNWPGFADAIFEVVSRLGVTRIIFMGSFGGTVPHTREPRLFGSVSEKRLLPLLAQHGLRPTDYEGPGSFATYLLDQSPKRKVEMLSVSAEIPGYLQGANPLSIEAVTRRLAAIMGIPVDLAKLREASTEWEMQVSEAVEKDEELTQTVRKLEEQYDNELIESAEQE
jgi:proteasome assembly chaperone (PAC2) family protein